MARSLEKTLKHIRKRILPVSDPYCHSTGPQLCALGKAHWSSKALFRHLQTPIGLMREFNEIMIIEVLGQSQCTPSAHSWAFPHSWNGESSLTTEEERFPTLDLGEHHFDLEISGSWKEQNCYQMRSCPNSGWSKINGQPFECQHLSLVGRVTCDSFCHTTSQGNQTPGHHFQSALWLVVLTISVKASICIVVLVILNSGPDNNCLLLWFGTQGPRSSKVTVAEEGTWGGHMARGNVLAFSRLPGWLWQQHKVQMGGSTWLSIIHLPWYLLRRLDKETNTLFTWRS